MSQGTDASKDAESAAQPSESQPAEPRAASLDATKDAESAAQPSESQPAEPRAASLDATKDAESAVPPSESQSAEPPTIAKASEEERAQTEPAEPRASSQASTSLEDELEPPIPETEEALNVPKNETVGMLAIISALTLILWFAARLACNAHPDQVREPKHFSTKELTADPKNTAFEFQHSFETGDFTTALDLATGEMKSLVENKLIECESSPDACLENQKKLAGSVTSTGTVVEQSPQRAVVELVSYYRKTLEPKTFQFAVEKRGDFWRVLARKEVPNRVAVAADRGAPPAASGAPSEPAAQPTQPE